MSIFEYKKVNMNKIIKYSIVSITGLLLLAAVVGIYYKNLPDRVESDDPLVWESDILEFEKNDKINKPPGGAILFIGSSSINLWQSLEKDMAPLPVIKRGFGGAKINDILYYMKRIVIPYKPKIIVFYCGENDISAGRKQTPDEILGNVKKFVFLVHKDLPAAKIYFISLKPSKFLWNMWPVIAEVNSKIEDYTRSDNLLQYIDISKEMFAGKGRIREDLFKEDGLHINAQGYKIWTSIIKPIIERDYYKEQYFFNGTPERMRH